eukprot:TRINITY_DN20095_c0_g3_i1.p1 TRINITY_DN20095_c0_g3~~TRINITY_DN20095_c0_g3_i1.p1  ORF type:complete len:428 (-),score=109.45 TRINITY_DN20095_c0_g3_i1:128-1411(-)
MTNFDWTVLWNQVVALKQNVFVWFLRTVVRVPPPALMPPGKDLKTTLSDSSTKEACLSVEIVQAGGVDQMRAKADSWALCGYNLMSEFGSQNISKPLATKDLPAGCVVVRNKAFSINYADICIRWGLYESALRFVGWPIVPGFDIAGVVEDAAAGSKFKPGDKIFGCSMFGAYSSRVVVPERQIMRMPESLSFAAAASLPAVAATALHAVHLAGLWPNEAVSTSRPALVHSAAGGVGDMLCQILKLRGIKVVGIVGSSSKTKACKADIVVDKSTEDWAAAAGRHAPDGYCCAFDANGVATLGTSYKLLARNGRLVVYGFHSNLPKVDGGLATLSPWTWLRMGLDLLRMPRFDPMELTLTSKAVLGFNLSFFADEHELVAKYLAQLQEWVQNKQIAAPDVTAFDIEKVRESHLALQSGRTVGKMVVTL